MYNCNIRNAVCQFPLHTETKTEDYVKKKNTFLPRQGNDILLETPNITLSTISRWALAKNNTLLGCGRKRNYTLVNLVTWRLGSLI